MKTLKESLLGDMETAVNSKYIYYPKNKDELYANIKECFKHNITDLNCINTSKITEMHSLFSMAAATFSKRVLAGFEDYLEKMDISEWDVSNVRNMSCMFEKSKFNGDISKWDVSNVEHMSYMFYDSQFNGDISKWNVRNVKTMHHMFFYSKFNGDISKWNVSKVEDMSGMFNNSQFNGDISKWNVQNVKNMSHMFYECPIKVKYRPKFK